MLFCVVGAKMSEGINFSDGLARCVAMVGLPFPNPSDPELRERMAYFDRTATTDTVTGSRSGGGQEYYENICMRAVNQSIGRAIRHRLDHATILLLDERYAEARIRSKLPRWIDRRVTVRRANLDEAVAVREIVLFNTTRHVFGAAGSTIFWRNRQGASFVLSLSQAAASRGK